MSESSSKKITPQPALTLAFVGTSLLWFAQFALTYSLAEAACNTDRLGGLLLGVPVWKWLILLVSLVLGSVIAWLGLRGMREEASPTAILDPVRRARQAFMGRVGGLIAALYLLVIMFSVVLTLFVPPCR